jgi:hypothetical protein
MNKQELIGELASKTGNPQTEAKAFTETEIVPARLHCLCCGNIFKY